MLALGIIPARGGSKGLPGKNLRLLAGEPLIAHAIRAAQASNLDKFVTSTDDEEIASVAARYGSLIVRRPHNLAGDSTPMLPVLLHALSAAESDFGFLFDIVILLQPTSPLRDGKDINNVIKMLEERPDADSVVSVCEMEDLHPARMYKLDKAGWLAPLWPEWEQSRRQDLPAVVWRNGAIYAARRQVLAEQKRIMGIKTKAYVMPRERMANIDEERDLIVAEALLKRMPNPI